MKQQLKDSLKEAMKAKDKVRLETIRGVLSEIQYDEMQKGIEEIDSDGALAVIQRELKKRREEVDFAQKATRTDLLEKLNQEIAILESFLPKQLSADEIAKIFQEIKAADASIQMGLAMKQLKERFAGQYDGKAASEVAKKIFG